MTLSEYLKFNGYKISITNLASIVLLDRGTLHRKYKRDPSTIDTLLERYNEQLKEFKR